MLPLWANYPQDKLTFAMDDEFMIGDGLLVKPVTAAGASSIEVYFPGQNEVNIWVRNEYDGQSIKFQIFSSCGTTQKHSRFMKVEVNKH
jgi:alpha-glucosidase (family GH31 glycosyl hydrolase)